jgi:hypothetical protein
LKPIDIHDVTLYGKASMLDLREALSQIADIRQQLSHAQTFRGYRSLSTGLTGLVAAVTACVQAQFVPNGKPYQDYLYCWFAAAVISILIVGIELFARARKSTTTQRQLSWFAIEQFLPSFIAGAMITYVIAFYHWESVPLLPGFWAILFGMGVFASRRLLPKPTFLIGGFYMLAGLLILTMPPKVAMSPWTMGLTFGIGQLVAAGMLYWTLERRRD